MLNANARKATWCFSLSLFEQAFVLVSGEKWGFMLNEIRYASPISGEKLTGVV
jgi:hypothetical protein